MTKIEFSRQSPTKFVAGPVAENEVIHGLRIENVSSDRVVASLRIEFAEREVPRALWFRPEHFDLHAARNVFREELASGVSKIPINALVLKQGELIVLEFDREELDAAVYALIRPATPPQPAIS